MYSVQSHWLQAPDSCHIQQVSMPKCVTTTHPPSRMRLMKERTRSSCSHSLPSPLCTIRFWPFLYCLAAICLVLLASFGLQILGCGVLSGLVTTISNIRRTTAQLVLLLLCIPCQRYEVHIRIAIVSSPLQPWRPWRLWRKHSIMPPKADCKSI